MNKIVNTFVISWCCDGLECVIPITELEQQNVMKVLSDKRDLTNINQIIDMTVLRARYNSQRHYEIYAITADDGITAADITNMFNTSPQDAADTMRRIGVKIHSDRYIDNKIVIR